MKIAGIWSGHDCSFCVLENGKPLIHAELERYNREKCTQGDSANFLLERYKSPEDIVHVASVFPCKKTTQYSDSFQKINDIVEENSGKFHFYSHHKAHAANAFYSSNMKKATIITMDGGGVETDSGGETACTIWLGDGKNIKHIKTFTPAEINIGGVWSRVTRYVFKLQNGWPRGGQEGSVMAMAAFGNSSHYLEDCWKWLTVDKIPAGFKPPNQPIGAYIPGKDPVHPYLDRWSKIADSSEQEKFNIAAALQEATEIFIKQIIQFAVDQTGYSENICISGGVTLNSVAMGKITTWITDIKDIYIPPVPYDAGLAIGAAQLVWHEYLGNPRVIWEDNFTPYLGETWDRNHIEESLKVREEELKFRDSSLDEVVDLIADSNIVSIFNCGSESGRRALGNRSILADPRNPNMKDIINKKVKHRQWFRPFAPSILYEKAEEWFSNFLESPYMQFVLPFKPGKGDLVPAVNHKNGTARLQTVKEKDNKWYYNFLKKWEEKTGIPMILNTSFNDREPICENATHAINCFLGTNIDYLYFPEHNILVERKKG